jgi:hypothetical protein
MPPRRPPGTLAIDPPLVPVTELMVLGLVRISMTCGVCTQGILKWVPSPTGSGSTPLNRSKMTALSPPSTAVWGAEREGRAIEGSRSTAATRPPSGSCACNHKRSVYRSVGCVPLYSDVWRTLTPTPRPTAYRMTLLRTPTTAAAASGFCMLAAAVQALFFSSSA